MCAGEAWTNERGDEGRREERQKRKNEWTTEMKIVVLLELVFSFRGCMRVARREEKKVKIEKEIKWEA